MFRFVAEKQVLVSSAAAAAGNKCGGRGGGREGLFDLCLTRRERDLEVSWTVEAFSLNKDQARLLWRCAGWFRPAGAETLSGSDGDRGGGGGGGEGEEAGDGRGEEGGRGSGIGSGGENAPPVVLVHGVFGE